MNVSFCCVCIKSAKTCFNMHDVDSYNSTWIMKLKLCVPEVEWKDFWIICSNCSIKINSVYEFRNLCIDSDMIRQQQTQLSLQKADENASSDRRIRKTQINTAVASERLFDAVTKRTAVFSGTNHPYGSANMNETCSNWRPNFNTEERSDVSKKTKDSNLDSSSKLNGKMTEDALLPAKCNDTYNTGQEETNKYFTQSSNLKLRNADNMVGDKIIARNPLVELNAKESDIEANEINLYMDIIQGNTTEANGVLCNNVETKGALINGITETPGHTNRLDICNLRHLTTNTHSKPVVNKIMDTELSKICSITMISSKVQNEHTHAHRVDNHNNVNDDGICELDAAVQTNTSAVDSVEQNQCERVCEGAQKKLTDIRIKKKRGRPVQRNIHLCLICSATFNTSKKLMSHMYYEHKSESKSLRPYKCDKCGGTFNTSSNLMQHKKYHTGSRTNMCSYCGKGFITKGDLNIHEKQHLNKREYKCTACLKCFNTHKDLRSHKLVVHTSPKEWNYMCNFCDKKFPIKSNLDVHVRRHTGDKRFACHLCDKRFIDKVVLQKHIKSHSNVRAFKCMECTREYKDKKVLEVHLKKVHGIGDAKVPVMVKKYFCHLCPKSYFAKNKLTRHICSHTGTKPHSCYICEKKFTDKTYVKQHLRLVHNVICKSSG